MIDRAAIARYNAGIRRAVLEYAAHPFSAWTYAVGCLCAMCVATRDKARDRMRRTYHSDPAVRAHKVAYQREYRKRTQ